MLLLRQADRFGRSASNIAKLLNFLDKSCIIYSERQVLVMCTKDQLEKIIEQIVAYSRDLFGDKFKSVILYGSYARGDYDDESDIDIMIMVDMEREELKKYRRMISKFFSELNLENGVFLTSKLQSQPFFNEWKNVMPFYQNVLKEGVMYA